MQRLTLEIYWDSQRTRFSRDNFRQRDIYPFRDNLKIWFTIFITTIIQCHLRLPLLSKLRCFRNYFHPIFIRHYCPPDKSQEFATKCSPLSPLNERNYLISPGSCKDPRKISIEAKRERERESTLEETTAPEMSASRESAGSSIGRSIKRRG